MNKEAAEVLKHIADKLDLPAEALWQGLVAYAPFYFWQWATVSAALLVLLLVSVYGIFRFLRSADFKHDGNASAWGVIFSGTGVFVAVIGLLLAVSYLANALSARYAPEAWAATRLIEMIRR